MTLSAPETGIPAAGNPAIRIIRALFHAAFHLLYHQMAFAYDAVAWVVSAGEWADWRRCVLPRLKAGSVLEIAHGTGMLSLDLTEAGHPVTALDLSPAMSRIAARKRLHWERNRNTQSGPRLLRADTLQLPFPSAAFDNVVCTFPAEFILKRRVLTEIGRCLKPGGRFVVIPSALPEWLAAGSALFADDQSAAEIRSRLLQPILPLGFQTRMEIIRRPRSRVWIIVAEKPV